MIRLVLALFVAVLLIDASGNAAKAEKQTINSVKYNFSAQPWSLDTKYNKQEVDYSTSEPPGTIIIYTRRKFLYLIEGNGKALRYGIGVGRDGFKWYGTERIARKAKWPDWHPPKEMRVRDPSVPAYMPGGEGNPLGARAMYLGNSLYRIHGTAQPWTIGTAVSSGCIRLTNDNVIDLYNRVKIGAKVVVE